MTAQGGRSGESPISLSMLGWALHEEDNVAEHSERAKKSLVSLAFDFELIVIDDGSTNRTAAIFEEHQCTRPWLRFYRNAKKRGPGAGGQRARADHSP